MQDGTGEPRIYIVSISEGEGLLPFPRGSPGIPQLSLQVGSVGEGGPEQTGTQTTWVHHPRAVMRKQGIVGSSPHPTPQASAFCPKSQVSGDLF